MKIEPKLDSFTTIRRLNKIQQIDSFIPILLQIDLSLQLLEGQHEL